MEKYSDLNLNFIKHPNTRDVLKRYDVDAVKTAVLNLIKTNHGEKKFRPKFGGNLRALLFETSNSIDADIMKIKWNDMLKMYEPRAKISNLIVTFENAELYIVLELYLTAAPQIKFAIPLNVTRLR